MKPRFLPPRLLAAVGATVALAHLQPSTAQNAIAQGQAPPLSIVVKPQQKQVHEYQPINLNVQVINTSATAQSFQVMSCSWADEWQASDPRIYMPGVPCFRNVSATITLAPGAAYEKTLAMEMDQFPTVGKRIKPGKLTFRIGFTPEENRALVRGRIVDTTYWSAPVTVQIIH